MKIVFLSDDFPPQSFGGAGISTYELALGMKKAGQEVSIITTCRHESEAGEADYNGLKVFKIASDYQARWRAYLSIYNPQVLCQLERRLRELNPDVVYINNVHFYLSYYSIKLSNRYARKVVFVARDAMSFSFGKLETEKYLKNFDAHLTVLDELRQAKRRWNPFRNILIKHYLGFADKIFAVSSALKEALAQNGINRVEVLHTGVNILDWQASEDEIRSFKKRFKDLEGKRIIFFSGRLNKAKGNEITNKVINEVKKEIPEVFLFTAGGDGYWLSRDEMRMAYAVSDIVLVPSICFDALPRTVLEASASGKPVISTPYGGAKEVIENGVTGYIVDPFDTKEMVRKVMDLLEDGEQAKRFGEAGRERIKTRFNLDDKIAEFLDTIKNR